MVAHKENDCGSGYGSTQIWIEWTQKNEALAAKFQMLGKDWSK